MNKKEGIYKIPLKNFFAQAISVDCVIFGYDKEGLKILLVKRGWEPFQNMWALPGDLVYPDEELNDAAVRVLKTITGLEHVFMEQFGVFGALGRHPEGRVITIGYLALVKIHEHQEIKLDTEWASDLTWMPVNEVKNLAFDHNEIFDTSIEKLRNMVSHEPIGFNLLPEKFSLNDIQNLYEDILDIRFDKANFRKKMLKMKILKKSDEIEQNVPHRPAKLFTVDDEKYHELAKGQFNF